MVIEDRRTFIKYHWVVNLEWTINDGGVFYFLIWMDGDLFSDRQGDERRSNFCKHHWMAKLLMAVVKVLTVAVMKDVCT